MPTWTGDMTWGPLLARGPVRGHWGGREVEERGASRESNVTSTEQLRKVVLPGDRVGGWVSQAEAEDDGFGMPSRCVAGERTGREQSGLPGPRD